MQAAIFLAALSLNRECKNSLLICLIVILSYYFPTELITNYYLWWGAVVALEVMVITTAISLRSSLSIAVACTSFLLLLCHMDGIVFNVYKDANYLSIVKFLEYLAGISCVLFSAPILNRIKGFVNA